MNKQHAQALLELIAECYLIITAPEPEPARNGHGPDPVKVFDHTTGQAHEAEVPG